MGALTFYLGVYCAAVPDYSQVLNIPHIKHQQLCQACIGQRTCANEILISYDVPNAILRTCFPT